VTAVCVNSVNQMEFVKEFPLISCLVTLVNLQRPGWKRRRRRVAAVATVAALTLLISLSVAVAAPAPEGAGLEHTDSEMNSELENLQTEGSLYNQDERDQGWGKDGNPNIVGFNQNSKKAKAPKKRTTTTPKPTISEQTKEAALQFGVLVRKESNLRGEKTFVVIIIGRRLFVGGRPVLPEHWHRVVDGEDHEQAVGLLRAQPERGRGAGPGGPRRHLQAIQVNNDVVMRIVIKRMI